MVTIVIGKDQGKVKEIITQMLGKVGNVQIDIVKQGDTIKVTDKESLASLVSLEDKIIELEDSLYNESRGALYKAVLGVIERPLIEHVLERTDGNQLKAARILGINRNTMRSKIRKLGINPDKWKV